MTKAVPKQAAVASTAAASAALSLAFTGRGLIIFASRRRDQVQRLLHLLLAQHELAFPPTACTRRSPADFQAPIKMVRLRNRVSVPPLVYLHAARIKKPAGRKKKNKNGGCGIRSAQGALCYYAGPRNPAQFYFLMYIYMYHGDARLRARVLRFDCFRAHFSGDASRGVDRMQR